MTREELAAWLILGIGILLIFTRDLVSGVIVGLVFFMLLEKTSYYFSKRFEAGTARPLALLAGTLIALAIVIGGIALLVAIVRAQMKNIPELMKRMASILESTRVWLTGFSGEEIFPEAVRDAEDFKELLVNWLKKHAAVIGIAGETFAIAIIHMVMGLLMAMMVFLRTRRTDEERVRRGSLAKHLVQKTKGLAEAFAQVISAQVLISLINTGLTAIYVVLLFPVLFKPLPFAVTIVFVTFVCGLIPVLGNLISNTVIVIVSLGVGTGAAIASLIFLVTIHKLEYVVNSKIIGSKTGSEMWEILLAVLIGEAAFGIPGIVLAPVLYTFTKRELRARGLV
ncbi:MAG TPA: AI-2E family transporter [Thermoanaerobaculia bacterium]